ncbi:MAG TPA: flavin reductase family protein [Thermomicrobiaceae bacterium]|nr:flavin reductase family protein [Thermomicrobiaceae bacterium]
MATVERDRLRDVLARFASGVVVVTTAGPDRYHGVTVSSFCSVSLDPPLVLACIDRGIQSHDLVAAAPGWAVNVLARDQSFLAEQFSGQTPLADPGFTRVPHRSGSLGAPLIDGCVGWIECRRRDSYPGGDHTIFVGEVVSVEIGLQDDPLVYFDRRFTELAWG